jgi:hypothetical protein
VLLSRRRRLLLLAVFARARGRWRNFLIHFDVRLPYLALPGAAFYRCQ